MKEEEGSTSEEGRTMGMRILIVEDDRLLAEAVNDYFSAKGWQAEEGRKRRMRFGNAFVHDVASWET